VVERM